ncbi:Tll0287-like domain-containing protein [Candidatus Nitrospira bockiana]
MSAWAAGWRGAWGRRLLGLSCALLLTVWGDGHAVSIEEAERSAHLLAVLFDSGRVVVDRNEGLIDDPHKGPKGFTEDVFEHQVRDEFLRRTGLDLFHLDKGAVPAPAKELLPWLLESSKQVVDEAQLVINQRGIGYKNFIPATFGSRTAARFSSRSHVRLKQTALRPRNPKNAPDAYEAAVLRRWAAQAADGTAETSREVVEDGRMLRVMTPIFYHAHCLACHGEPAGAIDVSGFPKEGAREGDLAGAISISIPLDGR